MVPFATPATLLIICAVALAAAPPNSPFEAVRQGDSIVATITRGRWLAFGDSASGRVSSPGESFRLRDGASFSLIEHHSSYDIRCHISPPPAGLQVTYSFDARSFGGKESEKKTYFIKTQ